MMGKAYSIISTNLTPPLQKSKLVSRNKLISKLREGIDRKLTTVIAPAGFGKTTLVSTWYNCLRSENLQASWLSVDAKHNDCKMLLLYITESIRQIIPSFMGATANILKLRESDFEWFDVMAVIVNELANMQDDVYFFLDDWHFVTQEESNQVIAELIAKSPDNFHLILASREKTDFSIARLRALDQLVELSANDLQFSQSELNRFCELENLKLSDQDLCTLNRNTEGWVIGIQLAMIAMRNRENLSEFLNSFSGGQHSIVEFLSDDVYNHQAQEIKDFLLKTSFLKRFCPSLCDYLFHKENSAQLIYRIEELNLFLFPLDDNHQWYRYHHLFAEFLQGRLQQHSGSEFNYLCLRSAQWFYQQGYYIEAIEYALSVGDHDFAARILNDTSEKIFAAGQVSTFLNQTEKIAQDALSIYPRVQLDRVWAYTLNWEFDLAGKLLDETKSYVEINADKMQDYISLQEKILHRELMVAVFSDQVALGEKLIKQWLDTFSSDNYYFIASVKACLLLVRREQFDCAHICHESEAVRSLFIKGDAEFGTVWHDCIVGPAYVISGDLERAKQVYSNTIKIAERINGQNSPLVAMPSLLLADVYYERNAIDLCETLLENNFNEVETMGFVDQLIAAYLCQSKLLHLRSKYEQAELTLIEGIQIAIKYNFVRLQAEMVGEQVRQAVISGKYERACTLLNNSGLQLDGRELMPKSRDTTTKACVALSWARAHRMTGESHEIITVLQSWVRFLEAKNCNRLVIRFSIALSISLYLSGENNSAKRYFMKALAAGCEGGFIRVFLDEGKVLYTLLKDLMCQEQTTKAENVTAFTDQLITLFESELDFDTTAVSNDDTAEDLLPMVDPLSDREIEILSLASTCLTNKQIADQLGVSLATIKWYMQKLYSKLGVHKRVSAVSRAKQLCIIP